MPTFRPDIFAEKTSAEGRVIEQIAVEAEIESTLFSEHTTDQLVKLSEFIEHQRKKRIRVKGFLLIPRGKRVLAQARQLLFSIPEANSIKVAQAH